MRRAWVFWLSPDDQPRWARPALLVVAALAGLAYAWGLDSAALEPFYGAAARSMSSSWHDFLFGAFDPNGTITVDKLPGALWIQALSLRAFGVNTWAIVLPQVVEGILTVLVLFRAVRRLAGPAAGLVAAVILAASPVTILLNRGNISDSLLILLLVLAADAASKAITTGRLRTLLLAGVWVGLAFQAKMTQAWLVLPGLFLAYLVASPARRRRYGHVALATVVVAVVSLSWMSVVSAVPAHDRPYFDGSSDNSVFTQVFDYNGWFRFEHPTAFETSVGPLAPFIAKSIETRTLLNASTATIPRSWHRLLSGPLGRDTAWLVPAALVSALAVLVARRRQRRYDTVRAAVILWGTWLVVHLVVFSDGAYLNSYYTAALTPAIAALCGIGLVAVGRAVRGAASVPDAASPVVSVTRLAPPSPVTLFAPFAAPATADPTTHGAPTGAGAPGSATTTPCPADGDGGGDGGLARIVLGLVVTGSAVYALWLLPTGTGVHDWLFPLVIVAAVAGDALLVASWLGRHRDGVTVAAVAVAAVALLLVPSVASATVVHDGLGPFDTPFEPTSVSQVTQTDARRGLYNAGVVDRDLEAFARRTHTDILFVTDTSAVAAAYILASGREVLPIGGFTGAVPSPTLRQIQVDIFDGRLRLAIVPVEPAGHDPRIVWIRDHCRVVSIDRPRPIRFGVYDCHNTI